MSSPAPPIAMMCLTPLNSWALLSSRLNWLDQTLIDPEVPLTWISSAMSFRLPWIRLFELGPIASVSVSPFSVPRKAGRLNGMSNLKSVTRTNSKVSVTFVMKRLIST